MHHFTSLPPLALYIHIPWCAKKCPYCDFNSHTTRQALPEQLYIDALIRDLDSQLPSIWGRSIISIFIGGGTPSLFSGESIDRLLCAVRSRLKILPDIEITLEANPGTVEQGKFNEYRRAGVNRLSIGVQSFQPDLLQKIGRIHDEKEAIRAAESAHAAGFDTFNLDLMYGLPTQTLQQALADIQLATELTPTHLSHYQLTIEPDTAFYKRPPVLPHDDHMWDMQAACQSKIAESGYTHYEVSAYSKSGHQCQHNKNYWQFGDYLGIGAGAHSKITSAAEQTIRRKWNYKQPERYMKAALEHNPTEQSTTINREDTLFEFMLNALRLTEGFDPALMLAHAGLPIGLVSKQLERAQELELIDWKFNHIKPSTKGMQFLNNLIELFIPEK